MSYWLKNNSYLIHTNNCPATLYWPFVKVFPRFSFDPWDRFSKTIETFVGDEFERSFVYKAARDLVIETQIVDLKILASIRNIFNLFIRRNSKNVIFFNKANNRVFFYRNGRADVG